MRYLIAAAALGLAGSSFADIINVPADYATIQAAVDAAVGGDEVVVAPGTYTGTGDQVVDMLGKAITLSASGTPEETIIDGEGARRGIVCTSNESTSTVIADLTISNCATSVSGAGFYANYGSPSFVNCTFANNTAANNGGGLHCDNCWSTFSNCLIRDNTSGNNGGGVFCSNSGLSFTNCLLSGNTSMGKGGGLYAWSSVDELSLVKCLVTDNRTEGAGTSGGGLSIQGNATLVDCIISTNTTAGLGGGVYCWDAGDVSMEDCVVSSNAASANGGGIYCSSMRLLFTNCQISSNLANQGAGVYLWGIDINSKLSGCTVQDNAAANSGGGLSIYGGAPVVSECLFDGNTALGGDGGGVHVHDEAQPQFANSGFRGNLAAVRGGGIFCSQYCSVYIGGCTLVDNAAVVGGALFADANTDYSTYLSESLVCGNASPQLVGHWTDGGENEIRDDCELGACCTGNQAGCVMATQEDCEFFGGTFSDYGIECADVTCPTSCLGDVNADGEVSVNDLLILIAVWGPCP